MLSHFAIYYPHRPRTLPPNNPFARAQHPQFYFVQKLFFRLISRKLNTRGNIANVIVSRRKSGRPRRSGALGVVELYLSRGPVGNTPTALVRWTPFLFKTPPNQFHPFKLLTSFLPTSPQLRDQLRKHNIATIVIIFLLFKSKISNHPPRDLEPSWSGRKWLWICWRSSSLEKFWEICKLFLQQSRLDDGEELIC